MTEQQTQNDAILEDGEFNIALNQDGHALRRIREYLAARHQSLAEEQNRFVETANVRLQAMHEHRVSLEGTIAQIDTLLGIAEDGEIESGTTPSNNGNS
jgi:hypothetical protein